MRKARFTAEDIVGLLTEMQAGASVQDLCRRFGISDTTFRKWRAKHESSELSDPKRLEQLEEENHRLKRLEEENRRLRALVADLTLSNQTLKLVAAKKW